MGRVIVFYERTYPRHRQATEAAIRDALSASCALQWYCKNGVCWWEGSPGAAMRSVRRTIDALPGVKNSLHSG